MKVLRVVSYVAAVAAAVMVGTLFGLRVERAAQAEEAVYQASLAERSRQIAVVTLDEGKAADGADTNYSSSILSSLGSEFRLTTYSQAKQGLSDGAYDAMIVIPADFTQKVDSVNAMNPQQITVDYRINKRLPEAAYIETVQLVENFQIDLNQELAYTFLASIYSELHDAQDKTGKLLSNDAKDLKAIEGVSAYNFTQNIQLGDMPQAKLELKTFDLSDFGKTVDTSAQEMNAAYTDIFEDMKNGYDETKDTVRGNIAGAGAELDALSQSNQAVLSWYDDAQKLYDRQQNPDTRRDSDHALKAVADGLGCMKDWICGEDGTCVAGGAQAWYNQASKYWTDKGNDIKDDGAPPSLDDILLWYKTMDSWYNDAARGIVAEPQKLDNISLQTWYETAKEWQDKNAFPSPALLPETPKADGQDISLPDLYDNACNWLLLNSNTLSDPSKLLDSWYADAINWYNSVNSDRFATISGAPPNPENYNVLIDTTAVKGSLSGIQAAADAYDPASYANEESLKAARGAADAIKNSAKETQKGLGEAQTDNNKQISDAYQAYNKYVSDLRQSVYDAYTNELTQVNEAKNVFVSTGKETSKENISLIGAFSEKMPNSRLGESVNPAVVEFSTAPVSFARVETRDGLHADGASQGDGLFRMILYICIAAIALSLIVRAARGTRKRSERR